MTGVAAAGQPSTAATGLLLFDSEVTVAGIQYLFLLYRLDLDFVGTACSYRSRNLPCVTTIVAGPLRYPLVMPARFSQRNPY